ncbi:MAG: hypothetical protein ACD_42C00318G0004 [uncultured bacterium]|nr:MAG: hypothetical protein ACD_42C00318G0004 [uncultured bacterium]OGT32686.1 MAG: hypothetical protein A3C44_00190 [Gammaproteobacteria bacterium RIFCSPHIGHO2_02_FULL_39_13]OGT48650.1 MAG: hypothetical protein A3E53_05160 [Gammaproteobacteria bacterium RIFCSPHIGHO2_12_FULL_39_24]
MIVVIGTGLAGYLFSKEFRKQDANTPLMLLTKSDGYFYSKPLLSTALAYQRTPDQLIMNNLDTMREQLNATILRHVSVFKIDPRHQKIFFLDEQHREHHVVYTKLILANGADPVCIPLQGDGAKDVLHVNQLEDYRIFRDKIAGKKRIAILGTGLVGCEFTNDLIHAGYHVTMIAPDNTVLARLVPAAVGDVLKNAFEKAGVQFYLSVFPIIVQKKKSSYDIVLSNHQKIEADVILSATGIKPNVTLAKTASVKTNVGIVVNSYLQTSDHAIFAMGDCAEVNGEIKMTVAPILQQAKIVAHMMVDKKPVIENIISPIVVKTPLCPVVILPPPKEVMGEWKIETDGMHVKALFYDQKNQLRGFVLSGNKVKEKQAIIQKLIS